MKTRYWLATGLFMFGASLAVTESEAMAQQPRQQSANVFSKLLFLVRGTPKDRKVIVRSGVRRRMAGVRGDNTPVALIPQAEGSYIGRTMSGNPTLWFYVPPTASTSKFMQLRLFDQSNRKIWAIQASLGTQDLGSGLLKIVYDGRPLADGLYFWKLTVTDRVQTAASDDRFVEGLSGYLQKETNPNLILHSDSQTRLRTYAQNGIWHELLTELVAMRQTNPGNQQLTDSFRSLIFESPAVKYLRTDDPTQDDVELMEGIVNAKVLDCCQFVPIK